MPEPITNPQEGDSDFSKKAVPIQETVPEEPADETGQKAESSKSSWPGFGKGPDIRIWPS